MATAMIGSLFLRPPKKPNQIRIAFYSYNRWQIQIKVIYFKRKEKTFLFYDFEKYKSFSFVQKRLLNVSSNGSFIKSQDQSSIIVSVSRSNRYIVLEYLEKNWKEILDKLIF